MAMTEYEISLVSAAKGGDSNAFEMLYNHYYGKIFALARATVKTEADAEDVLQQTFILAWRNLRNLVNPAGFNTWLQKITLNQSYSLLRKKNIAILIDAESDMDDFLEVEESDELLPAVYAERDDLRFRLGKIIDGLSEVQKQTIVLFYFNEQKVEEIADIMECSVGTVKTRLFLARKAIRSEVEEEERKSGEKFYGIVGIPMLSLGGLIVQQINYQVPYAEIHATALAALREAISQGIPMVGAPPAPPYGAPPPYVPGSEGLGTAASTAATNAGYGASAGNAATAAAVAKTSKIAGLSLTAKILIAVCAVALCAGLVYLGVQYFGGTEAYEPFDDYDDYYVNDIVYDYDDIVHEQDITDEYVVDNEEEQPYENDDEYEPVEVDLANLAEEYLRILREHGELVSGTGVQSVAVVDLTGDGIPELIFLRQRPGYNQEGVIVDIFVYGLSGGNIVRLLIKENIGLGAVVYYLNDGGIAFKVVWATGDSAFFRYYIYDDFTSEATVWEFSIRTWDQVTQSIGERRFYIDDIEVSREEYINKISLIFADFEFVLLGNSQSLRVDDRVDNFTLDYPDDIDGLMTYAQAIAYLEAWLVD